MLSFIVVKLNYTLKVKYRRIGHDFMTIFFINNTIFYNFGNSRIANDPFLVVDWIGGWGGRGRNDISRYIHIYAL